MELGEDNKCMLASLQFNIPSRFKNMIPVLGNCMIYSSNMTPLVTMFSTSN